MTHLLCGGCSYHRLVARINESSASLRNNFAPNRVTRLFAECDTIAVGWRGRRSAAPVSTSGAHNTLFPAIIRLMREKGGDDVAIFGGGIISRTTSRR